MTPPSLEQHREASVRTRKKDYELVRHTQGARVEGSKWGPGARAWRQQNGVFSELQVAGESGWHRSLCPFHSAFLL